MRRVVIAEMYINGYRVPFFNRLRDLLAREGVELQLLTGNPSPAEAKKNDRATLGWEIQLPCRYFFNNRVCWLPFGRYARNADLVIVTQENKLIYNLWLMFFGRPKRLAFWGHGRNMQSTRSDGLKEQFKRWTVGKVDWWFAYTELTAALVNQTGFSRERTTVVDNSVDTSKLGALCRAVTPADCQQMRQRLGLDSGPVGLYLGSLQKMKRLDFLLDAARRIREQVPGFQLLVAGAGPDQQTIEAAARENAWIHYVGPLSGAEKANALVLADVLLNPGAVGLGILDSFVSGTPYFTTECGIHGPEIAYLESGRNGVITTPDVEIYSEAVIAVLSDPAALVELREGALGSASRYTIENMADRFSKGILACLAPSRPLSKESDAPSRVHEPRQANRGVRHAQW
jgi:glycosyltransferase involved in cell wall biosynthesis